MPSANDGRFVWYDHMTGDSNAATAFYSEVVGWKTMQEMDMGPMGIYRVFGVGDKSLGGMMTAPKDQPMPSMWIYYAETSDIDAAIARATRMGAKVMNGPMEVPGGSRIA